MTGGIFNKNANGNTGKHVWVAAHTNAAKSEKASSDKFANLLANRSQLMLPPGIFETSELDHSVPLAQDATVLVLKNIPKDTTVADLKKFIAWMADGTVPKEIEYQLDSKSQVFKGTAHLCCANEKHAQIIFGKLYGKNYGDKKLRVEFLNRSKSFLQKTTGAQTTANDGNRNNDRPIEFSEVSHMINNFLNSKESQLILPSTLTSDQRKAIHAVAERNNLMHVTVGGEGRPSRLHLTKKSSGLKNGSFKSRLSPKATPFVPMSESSKMTNESRLSTDSLSFRSKIQNYSTQSSRVRPGSESTPSRESIDLARFHATQAEMHAKLARQISEQFENPQNNYLLPKPGSTKLWEQQHDCSPYNLTASDCSPANYFQSYVGENSPIPSRQEVEAARRQVDYAQYPGSPLNKNAAAFYPRGVTNDSLMLPKGRRM